MIQTGNGNTDERIGTNNIGGIAVIDIPIWEKYTLSIEEAASYFRIGENKLRRLINENPDADYILWNGTRAQIKRKKFEEVIDNLSAI